MPTRALHAGGVCGDRERNRKFLGSGESMVARLKFKELTYRPLSLTCRGSWMAGWLDGLSCVCVCAMG